MATYLGNASLSPAVKERVLSTFQQAITLYKQGRHDEVIQGSDKIMDWARTHPAVASAIVQ